MGKWKAEIERKVQEFEDVRDQGIFLRREFVPVIIQLVEQNENFHAKENSFGKVTSPEGEDVSEFAYYAIFYTTKDGDEVKLLFAFMEDESSQLVGVEAKEKNVEKLLEAIFMPETIEELHFLY